MRGTNPVAGAGAAQWLMDTPDRAWLADAVVWDNHACMPLDVMLANGYPREAILKIIGGNHMRVAAAVWHQVSASLQRRTIR